MKKSRELVIVAFAALLTIGAGCAKKKVAAATTAAPAGHRHAPTPAAAPVRRDNSAPEACAGSGCDAAVPLSERGHARAYRQLLARIEDAYFDYDQAHAAPGRHQGAAG